MRLPSIVLVLGTWGGWFALERWTNSISEILDPIHPNLADGILVGLFGSAGLVWLYDHKKNSPQRKIHSKKLVLALQIMSKGEFKNYLEKQEFCIPYPYNEYKESQRRRDFPTNMEIMELFNKKDWSESTDTYDLIPLHKSPEAPFDQAICHIKKGYDSIYTEFLDAKEAFLKFNQFCKDNEENTRVVVQRILSHEKQPEPFFTEWNKLVKTANDSLQTFQKSLEILAQQLDNEVIIKGKCELGY